MRAVVTILIIISAQCVYSHVIDIAKSMLNGIASDIGGVVSNVSNVISDTAHEVIPDCFFGVRSVSMVLFTGDISYGKDIKSDEACYDIDPSKPIVFLVHGFISSANNSNSYELASSLIEKGYTVFSLDWSDAACTTGLPIVQLLGYPSAVNNTREIGHHMAKYVISLNKKCNISLNQITFIGHSLGSHVSGFAAKILQELGYGSIPRLFAADPAQPLFGLNKCKNRLCDTDADRVTVLHTSELGIPYPMGHLDLYFNNAHMQPGCHINIACSHSRAVLYLSNVMENIDCGFPGVPFSPGSLSIQRLFQRPSYPGPDTTNCIVVDAKIFKSDRLTTGQYYVFVESSSDPTQYCTQKKFNCKL